MVAHQALGGAWGVDLGSSCAAFGQGLTVPLLIGRDPEDQMPTILPRFNVTVTAEQHRLLSALGALQGRSAASYLRQMLDGAEPMLAALLKVLSEAEYQQDEASRALSEATKWALRDVGADNPNQIDWIASSAAMVGSSLPAAKSGAEADRTERSEGGPTQRRKKVQARK